MDVSDRRSAVVWNERRVERIRKLALLGASRWSRLVRQVRLQQSLGEASMTWHSWPGVAWRSAGRRRGRVSERAVRGERIADLNCSLRRLDRCDFCEGEVILFFAMLHHRLGQQRVLRLRDGRVVYAGWRVRKGLMRIDSARQTVVAKLDATHTLDSQQI